ncbi:hypothetical protein niasHS_011366 [Heterodera schachtii]|uniref:Uncharacterized protein n=1 Tax=Heterodera schachtii TaxID=97005 RepID=A0ABD2IIG9_HETSC
MGRRKPQPFSNAYYFVGLGTGDLFEILSKNSKKISNGTTFASSSSSRQKSGANFVRFRLQHTARVLSLCERMCQEGQKAKLDQGGGDTAKRRGDIIYYMRQAKSIDAKEARDGERRARAVGTAYAFGSSTPRSLSHMSKVPREQRVYDAKLAKDQRTSATAFDGVRASATNPHLANKRWVGGGRSISTDSRNEEDEAASEPDIVQDRNRLHAAQKGQHNNTAKAKHSTGSAAGGGGPGTPQNVASRNVAGRNVAGT